MFHLEKKGAYVRLLFDTIIPRILDRKLQDLGLHGHLSLKNNVARPPRLPCPDSTGAPQGCMLSPVLYSLYTYDCTHTHHTNTIVKFEDDTPVLGFISDPDETTYRDKVCRLIGWCAENNPSLNVKKTKELILDFRRKQEGHLPLRIGDHEV